LAFMRLLNPSDRSDDHGDRFRASQPLATGDV
jgi:hypothetical protein